MKRAFDARLQLVRRLLSSAQGAAGAIPVSRPDVLNGANAAITSAGVW